MRKLFVAILLSSLSLPAFAGKDKEVERLHEAGTVMKEVLNIPEGIPQGVLDKAECVVVLPSVKKAAFILDASYGRGVMVCRTGEHFTGPWSEPVMMALEGGGIGFQIGGEATDYVLLLMSPKSAKAVLGSKVKLGADASAAAGPKGRSAQAATDASMRAEILSYSRARGVFAGVSLEGSTLRADGGANENLYGRKINAKSKISTPGPGMAAGAATLVSLLNKKSPVNKSKPKSLD